MKRQDFRMPGVAAAVILATAATLWFIGANQRSLWIDEFHGLHHERAADLPSFFESVRTDNHPPLAFLAVRVSRSLFGESPLALRLPSILCGLALLLVLLRFTGSRLAPLLVVASPYALMIFTEARMYSFLALAATGLLASASRAASGRGRGWPLMIWTAIGLHAHYFFVYSLAVTIGWLAWRAFRTPTARAGLVRNLVWIGAGGVLFLPWFGWAFVDQLHHGLPVGRSHVSARFYVESLLHLFFINARAAGDVTYAVAIAGMMPAALLLIIGGLRAVTGRSKVRVPWLMAGLCFGAPALAILAALVAPRAGFNWRYVAASLVPACLLVADAAAGTRRLGRAAGAVLLAAMAFVVVANAVSPGREDNAGAVRHLVANHRPGDAVVVHAVKNPDGSRTLATWHYYAERDPEPARARALSVRPLTGFDPGPEHRRVWVFLRTRFPDEARKRLEASYPIVRRFHFGADRQVILFAR